MAATEAQRAERELMRWFRALSGEEQRLVVITPRERGYTAIAPRRRLPVGRNVSCWLCERRRVWFTNEPGDKGRRRAQVAAARHLWAHLRADAQPGMPPESGSGSTLPAETPVPGC